MRRCGRSKDLDVDASLMTDGTATFRYPILLRYVLRCALPAIAAALFLFSLSNGWSSDNLLFGAFCAAVSLPWWWAFRRYGLTIRVNREGIHFVRGRKSTLAKWTALSAIWFSASGVSIAADGKRWHVLSDLSGWDQFERLLRDRASSEALAARPKPPFCIRTKWAGVIQPGIFCAALLIGGISQFATGQWKPSLVMLGVGGLFLFLLRGAVLWYRFDEDALFVQRLTGRERYPWSGLQFATITEMVLAMSFADECFVAVDGKQIARSVEDIFLSMQPFWGKHASSGALCAERRKPIWSWPVAAFWWTIIPVLVLVTFPEVIDSIRVKLGAGAYVCESIAKPEGACQTLHHIRTLLRFDIAVLPLMFVMVAGIHWAGEYCNRRREKLLSIFRPALALTITSTILILAAQSALLAALLYYVPLELANMRLTGLLITVIIGLVLGLYHIVRNTWSAVRPASLELNAVSVLQIEQPELWNLASSVAQNLGAPPPDNILLGLEPNYFATESHIRIDRLQANGYSLYISIPATRMMTEPELRAIIGHEFGHFRGADTAFTKHFFPPYNSAVKTLAAMANAPGSWSLLPAIYMLHFFLVSFGKAQSALSRDREFLADNAGAEASSSIDLASALVKLELFTPRISALVQERVYTDRATTAIGEQIHFTWPTIIPESLLEAQTPHPFDSHPALGSRLKNLKVDLSTILAMPIACGAARIFHTPEALEARLLAEMRAKSEVSTLSGEFTFVPNLPN
jgi:Zn-dependent protease with chaperone function